jgi:hypothetical protein
VPSKHIAECACLDRLILQELRYADQVFRPADSKRRSHEVLGAQNARPDRTLAGIDLDFNILGMSQRLGVASISRYHALPGMDPPGYLAKCGQSWPPL